ncbi:hypothetical protein PT286_04800 [Neisseriaceae bacterium ESL0693]|nr:hypothetical protein [Neisseriaceae bacterium ESL0693]
MYPIETQDKLFHDGDGVTELGTVVTALFLNTIQAELLGVVNAAGIQPAKVDQNQVAKAILQLIQQSVPESAKSLTTTHKIGGLDFNGTQDVCLPVSAGFVATQLYQPGDLVKLDGHWYECYHPDGCKGKDPRDKANRPSGWNNTDETKPYYWVEVGMGSALSLPEIGSPIYLPTTSLREGLIKYRGDANLHKNKFWRLAQRYPNLVQGNYIRIADLRGEFLRGWDDQRGVDPNRVVNSGQGDAIRNITGRTGYVLTSDVTPAIGVLNARREPFYPIYDGSIQDNYDTKTVYREHSFAFDASRVVPTADENRPRNIAMMIATRF